MPVRSLARHSRAEAELEISRSRFLGFARRCDDEDQARSFFADIRTRFPDARHHCTALSVGGPVNPTERSSDDGEPAGTAGMPILNALRGSGLCDVAVVVVRYFGGIKLGTGGLVRAYTEATQLTLAAGAQVELITQPTWQVVASAAEAGRWHAAFHAQGVEVLDVVYGLPHDPAAAQLTVTCPDGEHGPALIASLTGGQAQPTPAGDYIQEVPLR